jgi:hypothetical protein
MPPCPLRARHKRKSWRVTVNHGHACGALSCKNTAQCSKSRSLLSSGSRVRILPGALLSFPRSTGYEPSHCRTPGDPHATGHTGRLVRICRSERFFAIAVTPCYPGSGSSKCAALTCRFVWQSLDGSQTGSLSRPRQARGPSHCVGCCDHCASRLRRASRDRLTAGRGTAGGQLSTAGRRISIHEP